MWHTGASSSHTPEPNGKKDRLLEADNGEHDSEYSISANEL